MKIIFLSAANLGDRLFFKDFVHRFSFKEPVIVLHEPHPGGLATTRMATKRISAFLSEAMVHNNAFSGDQKGMVKQDATGLKLNIPTIESLLQVVPVVVLGPVAATASGSELINAQALVTAHRFAFDAEVICFVDNPLSPLATKRNLIEDEATRDKIMNMYEEEQAAISRAYDLRPALLAGPANFAQ